MMRAMRALAAAVVLAVALPAQAADRDPWISSDKGLHFGVSAALAGGSYQLSASLLPDPHERAAVSATLAFSVGAAKELYDLTGRGDPSWKDLTWDAARVLVGVGLSLALELALGDRASWR